MTAPRKRAPAKRTTKAAAPRQSQRDRLLGRSRPSLPYRLLVAPDQVEAARARLAKAQQAARQPLLRGDAGPAATRADKAVAEAEVAVDACYETILLRALPPDRIEQLDAEHPPTPEQMARAKADREQAGKRGEQPPEWPSYNDATYWPALLAESATDAGMTADDWAVFLAEHVSTGEAAGIKQAVLGVNRVERVADPLVLPKGWMPNLS